ncbi:MAG: MarR family winged helix-turn-helix transcriptional regulator, partial [Gammaproteobacteria bacterium]
TLNLAFRGAERVDDVEIAVRDWRILSYIASTGPHTNREIAEVMGLDSATISRAVQYLKSNGLIDVRRSKRDRRMQLIMLTQKGADAHDAIAPQRKAFVDEVESCLTDAERRALYRALDKIDAFFAARRIEHDEWE